MTRPKRTGSRPGTAKKSDAGGKPAGISRGRPPKKNTARGRDGTTRDTTKVAREPGSLGREEPRSSGSSEGRRYGVASSGSTQSRTGGRTARGPAKESTGRATPPRVTKAKKPLPELKRVQLKAPAPDTEFRDRDGVKMTFPDSNLRRVAAQILTEKRKAWRYRPFSFPLFTDKGHEQAFHFDFYVYDAEDSVIKLILVTPHESREVWDRVGRFKRQYPMYAYELWTPEKLEQLSGPRGHLGF
ncbi:hypothetical protein [Deinococcus cavernae]|uniref:hypothetical protein n=1 Tax=Deinococcus cavernae TaxID=2320857 RepID=UPI001F18CFAC|nr:hypothetical protein [Deinococcus cavernae]